MPQELPVIPELQDQQVRLELRVTPVQQDLQVPLALPVIPEQQARQVLLAQQDLLVPRVIQEQLVLRD